MNFPRHVMILASAGSGKTYALTNRFVALLAAGAAPERIVALTFTRKAAGEFFDEILTKLARAASEPELAAKLARDIGAPRLGPGDFLVMLRRVTEAMHRLRLGTLDAFFARVARAFPLELGLTGDFEILQEHTARRERRRVLRRMFARDGGALAAAQADFIESFKRATFGREEKRLGAQLDGFLDDHQEKYLAAPDGARWGRAEKIWPGGCAWLSAAGDASAAASELRAWAAAADIGDKQRARWESFFTAVATWSAGAEVPRELAYVLEKALAAWPDLAAGRATTLEFDRKKQELTPAAAAALAGLARGVVGAELTRKMETTRGIFAVLRGYEAVYHDAVRRAGRLTFGDVQRLLQPVALTRDAAATGAGRLYIDYRLDAEIDHWLLDEFQDTSHAQWGVLKNLVDEAVQDAEGARTFFCVGDVKQAIFAWREGDARLFGEIFNHYNSAAPGTIAEESLVESWRSGPPLIEMVNAVFGDAAALAELFPGVMSARWNGAWKAHASAVPERTGQAALLLAADEDARRALALQILQEVRPLERGLTCAVLVKTNGQAAAVADFLRANHIPAVAESDLKVGADNPVGAALLALVQAAAHPGDTLAWEHVLMTPLRDVLAAEGIATREALTERVLAQIHAEGFEQLAEFWWTRLEPPLAGAAAETGTGGGAFARERARQFAAAAGLFDATGSREAAEFGEFMRRHTVREAEGAAVVRVMTVHKAKGLGFDVVVLPELEGKKLDERREGLAVQKSPADRAVEWVLDLPPKIFREQDPVLAAHVREAEAEAGYENLSLLYVAMTRAKRAMYVITEPPGKSTSRNFPRLLAATLGADAAEVRVGILRAEGVWSSGDPDWFCAVEPGEERGAGSGAEGIAPVAGAARVPRRLARRPSAEKRGALAAAQLFALERAAGAEFGTAVHELFAAVEWGSAVAAESFAAEWAARGEAGAEALACLRAPELAGVWAKPGAHAEVWRERAFEIVLEDAWVTGVFDRVVVERDAAGRAVRAVVFDFKTDRVADESGVAAAVLRHTGQLNVYRRVAARLTGLSLEAVAGELVLTRGRRRAVVGS